MKIHPCCKYISNSMIGISEKERYEVTAHPLPEGKAFLRRNYYNHTLQGDGDLNRYWIFTIWGNVATTSIINVVMEEAMTLRYFKTRFDREDRMSDHTANNFLIVIHKLMRQIAKEYIVK